MSSISLRVIFFLLTIYLLSISIRLLFPTLEKPHLNHREEVIEWDGTEVIISYLEFGTANEKPPIIIFSDPFFNLNDLEPFAVNLSNKWQVIIPDHSIRTPDGKKISQSAKSSADFFSAWLEQTNLNTIHLAGHGFGNAVAIEFLDADSEFTIESYTLLSGLGVQEFHFLGYHLLNQPVYSLLYPVAFMVDYGLPLAWWNKKSIIDLTRVRYMTELDQRPYREIMSSLDMPVLIMHGKNDRHVSVETAHEHHRILPQSELVIFDGDRQSIADHFGDWIIYFSSFLNSVENGDAFTRNDALQDRVERAERSFQFGNVPPVYGWNLLFIILLLSSVTLVSEDLGCIGGGLLVAGGVIPIWLAFCVIYIGIIVTDVGIYWLGRLMGKSIITNAPIRWLISKRDVDWSADMFHTNGFKIIFASRFLPGTRFPTYFTAGLLKTNFNLFLIYFLIAITIWTPLLLAISIVAGQAMLIYLQIYQDYALYIFVGLVVGLYLLFKLAMPLATKKGRREFVVRAIRLRQRFISS